MKILFITRLFNPHIGGVEKHVYEVSKNLLKKGNSVTVLTEKYDSKLKNKEIIDGVKVIRFSYPHFKFFGLMSIWIFIWKNRKLINNSDIVHIHDVFIWYLPFWLLYSYKKIFTTFHGWEVVYPIPILNIFIKKMANRLSYKTISVGRYIEKYYKIETNKIIYGGVSMNRLIDSSVKIKNSIVFVGRLEPDTGLGEFLKYLKINKQSLPLRGKYKQIDFVGDGSLRSECQKFGIVHGFTDPIPFYKKAETVVPSGYLTYLEAKSWGCKLKTFYSTELKKEYWEEILKLKKFMTWDDVADEYLDLYHSI